MPLLTGHAEQHALEQLLLSYNYLYSTLRDSSSDATAYLKTSLLVAKVCLSCLGTLLALCLLLDCIHANTCVFKVYLTAECIAALIRFKSKDLRCAFLKLS